MKDKNRTVSRRSEPNSRNFLMDEQSNPSKFMHLEVKLSRHRGAKQCLGSRSNTLLACYPRSSSNHISTNFSIQSLVGHYNQLSLLFKFSFLQNS